MSQNILMDAGFERMTDARLIGHPLPETTRHPVQSHRVAAAQVGHRLDQTVAQLAGFSVGAARRLLAEGGVHLNGKVATLSHKGRLLTLGETLAWTPEDPNHAHPPVDAGMALSLLAEGAGGVIVDKPAGVPVHPLRPQEGGTVLGGLLARWPDLVHVGEGGLRGGVVHRLDVTTSGALAFALDQATWERWRAAMTGRVARKRYLALVAGTGPVPAPGRGWHEESAWLALGAHAPARVRVVARSQREAAGALPAGTRHCTQRRRVVSAWAVSGGWRGLVAVDLQSGFLHQIRVMLAAQDLPLVGDMRYAPASIAAEAPRPMLHAAFLAVEDLVARAPWPADFQHAVRQLGGPTEAELAAHFDPALD